MEYLNTILVDKELRARGLKKLWVIREIGLSRTTGYSMIREGLLPKDETLRMNALTRLAELIDCTVDDLIVEVDTNRSSA